MASVQTPHHFLAPIGTAQFGSSSQPNYAKSIGGMWDSQITWFALYLGLVAWEMLGSG
jgi:hypothetical protein